MFTSTHHEIVHKADGYSDVDDQIRLQALVPCVFWLNVGCVWCCVVGRGVVWCGVVWRGVVRWGVVWRGVATATYLT